MYSAEVVDKATSAVAMGFSCNYRSFKESVKELPEEIQAMVLTSVLAGRATIRIQMRQILSKASEIDEKLKEMKTPSKEDVDKLLREVFERMGQGKQQS